MKIDDERVRIIQKLGVNWSKVASSLRFDYSVLETLEYDYRGYTEKACEEMFRR